MDATSEAIASPDARAAANLDFTEPTPPTMLRLMCSFGGHILPRRHDKALCYVGGETRLVGVERRIASSYFLLIDFLSHRLLNGRPVSLRYKLPNDDLDSLISITSEEDVANMIDEYDNIPISPQSSRLRFFLFHDKPDLKSLDSVLQDAKSKVEEGQVESVGKDAVESVVAPESRAFETSPSFGSTDSSASVSDLLPAWMVDEEGNGASPLKHLKVNLAPLDSIWSDSTPASPTFPTVNVFYQDPVGYPDYINEVPDYISVLSAKTDSLTVEGYPLSQPTDHLQPPPRALPQSQLQEVHPEPLTFVYDDTVSHPEYGYCRVCLKRLESGSNESVYPGIHCCYTGTMAAASYPTIYQSSPQHQQQSTNDQLNTPLPDFLMPIEQEQPYDQLNDSFQDFLVHNEQAQPHDVSVEGNVKCSSCLTPRDHLPSHSNAVIPTSSLFYEELTPCPPAYDFTEEVCRMTEEAIPPPTVLSNEHPQQIADFPSTSQPSQPTVASAAENSYYLDEYEDPDGAEIYKSQPPAPKLYSLFEAMPNDIPSMLSEYLTQLSSDITKRTL
ncbi:hypothetical protein Nepgr_029062 [Nepenthes gracilis]|uniref:PB1 domain-containing protein n=1 Tax=Nepenthes gracilis TaxID=150966 RepID=A0AAD3TDC3_NEPGR|nr:hypothetical protein Nepgr_029062 [Nepenthes gracilis]